MHTDQVKDESEVYSTLDTIFIIVCSARLLIDLSLLLCRPDCLAEAQRKHAAPLKLSGSSTPGTFPKSRYCGGQLWSINLKRVRFVLSQDVKPPHLT